VRTWTLRTRFRFMRDTKSEKKFSDNGAWWCSSVPLPQLRRIYDSGQSDRNSGAIPGRLLRDIEISGLWRLKLLVREGLLYQPLGS
jgi:hypothetical protein